MASKPYARFSGQRFGRIAAELRDRIEEGELAAHERLPSERELCRRYGVARMTVRQALAELGREGLVYTRAGIGTFVCEPRVGVSIGSLSDGLSGTERDSSTLLLRVERGEPTPQVAQALGLAADGEVLTTVRLRYAQGEPLAVETSHWPEELMPNLFENITEGSLWELARDRYGLLPTRVEAALETSTVDRRYGERLDVKVGSAAFLLTRWTYDQRGRCFEFARDLYRGDRTMFRINQPVTRSPGGGLLILTE